MKIPQIKVSRCIRRLYNKIGAEHEKIRDDGEIDSEVLSKLLTFLPKNLSGKIVFDAGGGSGHFSQLVLERGAEKVICMDISDFMLRLARKRKTKSNLVKLEVKKGDFTKTKLPNNSIDIILSIYSLPHVSDINQAFKEFSRTLKPKGLLFLASDYYDVSKKSLAGREVLYNLGKIKLIGFIHNKAEIQQSAYRNYFSQKQFFTVKKPKGLSVSDNFQWKQFVKIHSFGAVFIKNK